LKPGSCTDNMDARKIIIFAVFCVISVAELVLGSRDRVAEMICAYCEMEPNTNLASEDQQDIRGHVFMWQTVGEDGVVFGLDLAGLDETDHHLQRGFHIHEGNDTESESCDSVGGHYNPEGNDHGGPHDDNRHVGDLGNVYSSAFGEIEGRFYDDVISLTGEKSIVGRAVVLHRDEDDLGLGGEEDSLTTGHAGKRLGCCILQPLNCPAMYALMPSWMIELEEIEV